MPRNKALEAKLETMVEEGLLSIAPGTGPERRYRVTPAGQAELRRLQGTISEGEQISRGRPSPDDS